MKFHFFETIKSYSISESELRERVNFKNFREISDKLNNNKKILVLASHQCNWEWLLLASQLNLTRPLHVIYKTISDKKFDKIMMYSRSRFGSMLIDSKKAMLYLKRNLICEWTLCEQSIRVSNIAKPSILIEKKLAF